MIKTVYRTDEAKKSAIEKINECIDYLNFSADYLKSRNITKFLIEYREILQNSLQNI